MTNYNERLDELMPCDCKFLKGFAWRKGDPCEGCINGRLKQSITSLIKELVAEAKPEVRVFDDGMNDATYFQQKIVDQFEQNLLKALEEI